MSYNFLPFITEKSSESSIFKAIIKRGKGLTSSQLSNLYALVLIKGINEIRKTLNNESDEFTATERITNLLAQYTEYLIPKSVETYWYFVLKNIDTTGSNAYDMTFVDRAAMFTTIAIHRPEKLLSAGFKIDADKFKYASETAFNILVADTELVFSTNDSTRIGFTCWEEFKAYTVYHFSAPKYKILPVFIDKNISKVNTLDYEDKHCSSPY
jgi:hypothetical protein